MLTTYVTVACLTLASAAAPATAPVEEPAVAQQPAGFLLKSIEFQGDSYRYCVYVPADYTPEKAWPVILFLHGSGERGRDGLLQTEVGIGTAIRRHADWFPALVVMPQCPPGQGWVGPNSLMALKCVEEVSRDYRCERDRLYLTGLSLGGQGAWHLAAAVPEFAGVIVVCGFIELREWKGATLEELAPKLTRTPIWVFHGDVDRSVPASAARDIVTAVRAAGGRTYYTEYKGVGHNAWDRAYGDPAVWRWLFEQKRGQAPTTQPADAQE